MSYGSPFLTIDGKPQERDRKDHPYSYTRYCIFNNGWKRTDYVVWSDRLRNEPGYERIKEEVLGIGDYFSRFPTYKIQEFLSKLFGYEVILTGIEEECNCSNGYPYWLLYYRKAS